MVFTTSLLAKTLTKFTEWLFVGGTYLLLSIVLARFCFGTVRKLHDRYSNIKGEMSKPRFNIINSRKTPHPKNYNFTLSKLIIELARKAALGNSRRKFATGEVNVTSNLKVYALLQCIPNLEEFDCLNCLKLIVNYTLTDCCYAREGSAAALPPFSSQTPPPPPPYTHQKGSKSKKYRVVMNHHHPNNFIIITSHFQTLQLDFGIVKAATNNFSSSNKLGQGGFGTVYKGRLPSGDVIAVKRLCSTNSGQGEKEFKNEALLISKLQLTNSYYFISLSKPPFELIHLLLLLPPNILLPWQTLTLQLRITHFQFPFHSLNHPLTANSSPY
ncbi:Cysteine-rich receptor-like protein kinase 25, partial [Bienertia sinuspersici]